MKALQYLARYTMPDNKGVPMPGKLCLTQQARMTIEQVRRKVAKTYSIPADLINVEPTIEVWSLPSLRVGGKLLSTYQA